MCPIVDISETNEDWIWLSIEINNREWGLASGDGVSALSYTVSLDLFLAIHINELWHSTTTTAIIDITASTLNKRKPLSPANYIGCHGLTIQLCLPFQEISTNFLSKKANYNFFKLYAHKRWHEN